MTETIGHQQLLGHFASLLSYPGGQERQIAADCGELLREIHPAAGSAVDRFSSFLQSHDPNRVEEVFTATFDLQPVCFPYVGYQLCGEGQQRALFLMELQKLYRRHGFDGGGELPDHLGTMLRFLQNLDHEEARRDLIGDGLIPALDKILQGMESGDQPYANLLQALRTYLAGTLESGTELSTPGPSGENRQKECGHD